MLQANVERYLHNVLDRNQYAYIEKRWGIIASDNESTRQTNH
jgi:hypothetical protein